MTSEERAWTRGLLIAAFAYALYRIVLTGVFVSFAPSVALPTSQRVVLSLLDGLLLAISIPLAAAASRRLPIERPHRVRNLVAHGIISVTYGYAWIVAMLAVGAQLQQRPIGRPLVLELLGWLTTNVFAYAIVVATLHALRYQQQMQTAQVRAAQLKEQLAVARLELLRSQLHPHFLFNTLHAISELIHVNPAAAEMMVVRLGDVLRSLLDFSGTSLVRLEREMELARAYLDIHGIRLGDRLSAEYDIDAQALDALVPPLILQPLIENALRHGLEPRRTPCHVRIAAASEGNELQLLVVDDGVGYPENPREGIGISNTRGRLEELYGDARRLVIGRVAPEGGTRAQISIPLQYAEARG